MAVLTNARFPCAHQNRLQVTDAYPGLTRQRYRNSILNRAGASGQGHTWEEEPSIYPPLTYAALSPIGLLPWHSAQ